MNTITIFQIISTIVVSVSAIIALVSYLKQQKFKRVQNLSLLWEKFFKEEKLRVLFSLLDEIELEKASPNDIKSIPNADKLYYLAVLDDVANFSKNGEIDEKYAIDKFQWFFYYAFISEKTAAKFWESLGGIEETKQHYWQNIRLFAEKCKKSING